MPDFALYASRRDGVVKLFSSRWGAPSTTWDALWGPRATQDFLERADATDAWLDMEARRSRRG